MHQNHMWNTLSIFTQGHICHPGEKRSLKTLCPGLRHRFFLPPHMGPWYGTRASPNRSPPSCNPTVVPYALSDHSAPLELRSTIGCPYNARIYILLERGPSVPPSLRRSVPFLMSEGGYGRPVPDCRPCKVLYCDRIGGNPPSSPYSPRSPVVAPPVRCFPSRLQICFCLYFFV